MLKFFKRRRRHASMLDTDHPLAVRDLLDDPALRALVIDDDAADAAAPSLAWTRLVASGPLKFESLTYCDLAA